MTIWQDVQTETQFQKKRKQWKAVRVVGLDSAYILGWGEQQPIRMAVDLGTGAPFALVISMNKIRKRYGAGWLPSCIAMALL